MNRTVSLLISTLLMLSIVPREGFAQAGNAGLSFLKLGVSGRGLAMGDAMSATVSGAAATYYNPAGLLTSSGLNSAQLMFMHREWIQDTRVEFLGSSIPLGGEHALGFSLISTTISAIEIRTRPGTPEGTFTARNLSVGASYSHAFADELRLGITGKFLYQKILIDESSGFAVDLGAQYSTSIENLSVGAVLANLGSMDGLKGGSTTLPTLARIGPAYSLPLVSTTLKLNTASDLLYIFPEHRAYVNVGGELRFNETVAGRLGYQFGSEARGFSGGIGISHGIFVIDYAYAHLSADLGNAHAFSLALNL